MSNILESFKDQPIKVAVIGASGGIGSAIVDDLCGRDNVAQIFALSRSEKTFSDDKITTGYIDILDEESVEKAAELCGDEMDLVIVASGMLGGGKNLPEKSLRNINFDDMQHTFAINTFGPALVAKHFLPLLPRKRRGVFAALSARVGSISDNQLGGWYSYRAAKNALNMIIKNAAIEMGRRYDDAVVIGLHPGAVDTEMTRPYHANISYEIFSPEKAAAQLLSVIDDARPQQSGRFLQWDGEEIKP